MPSATLPTVSQTVPSSSSPLTHVPVLALGALLMDRELALAPLIIDDDNDTDTDNHQLNNNIALPHRTSAWGARAEQVIPLLNEELRLRCAVPICWQRIRKTAAYAGAALLAARCWVSAAEAYRRAIVACKQEMDQCIIQSMDSVTGITAVLALRRSLWFCAATLELCAADAIKDSAHAEHGHEKIQAYRNASQFEWIHYLLLASPESVPASSSLNCSLDTPSIWELDLSSTHNSPSNHTSTSNDDDNKHNDTQQLQLTADQQLAQIHTHCTPPIDSGADMCSSLLILLPHLTPLLVRCMQVPENTLVALRHTAFLLDTLGCGVATEFPILLRAIMNCTEQTPVPESKSTQEVETRKDPNENDTETSNYTQSNDVPSDVANDDVEPKTTPPIHVSPAIREQQFRLLRSCISLLPTVPRTVLLHCLPIVLQHLHRIFPSPILVPTTTIRTTDPSTSFDMSRSLPLHAQLCVSPRLDVFSGNLHTNTKLLDNTERILLLQLLLVLLYRMQGDVLCNDTTIVDITSAALKHIDTLRSLLFAMHDTKEDIRRYAMTCWCCLRDVYPLALTRNMVQLDLFVNWLETFVTVNTSAVSVATPAVSPSPRASCDSALSTTSTHISSTCTVENLALVIDLAQRVAVTHAQIQDQHRTTNNNNTHLITTTSAAFGRIANTISTLLQTELCRTNIRSLELLTQLWFTLAHCLALTHWTTYIPEHSTALITLPLLHESTASSPAPSTPDTLLHAYRSPILHLACTHMLHSAPSSDLLKLLRLVLPHSTAECTISQDTITDLRLLLLRFCVWIPHSVNDETFELLNALLTVLRTALTPDLIIAIISAMTDRYTVRSTAYRHTRDLLVAILVRPAQRNHTQRKEQNYITTVLQHCLLTYTENKPTTPATSGLPSTIHSVRSILEQLREHLAFLIQVLATLHHSDSGTTFSNSIATCLYTHTREIGRICFMLLRHAHSAVRLDAIVIMGIINTMIDVHVRRQVFASVLDTIDQDPLMCTTAHNGTPVVTVPSGTSSIDPSPTRSHRRPRHQRRVSTGHADLDALEDITFKFLRSALVSAVAAYDGEMCNAALKHIYLMLHASVQLATAMRTKHAADIDNTAHDTHITTHEERWVYWTSELWTVISLCIQSPAQHVRTLACWIAIRIACWTGRVMHALPVLDDSNAIDIMDSPINRMSVSRTSDLHGLRLDSDVEDEEELLRELETFTGDQDNDVTVIDTTWTQALNDSPVRPSTANTAAATSTSPLAMLSSSRIMFSSSQRGQSHRNLHVDEHSERMIAALDSYGDIVRNISDALVQCAMTLLAGTDWEGRLTGLQMLLTHLGIVHCPTALCRLPPLSSAVLNTATSDSACIAPSNLSSLSAISSFAVFASEIAFFTATVAQSPDNGTPSSAHTDQLIHAPCVDGAHIGLNSATDRGTLWQGLRTKLRSMIYDWHGTIRIGATILTEYIEHVEKHTATTVDTQLTSELHRPNSTSPVFTYRIPVTVYDHLLAPSHISTLHDTACSELLSLRTANCTLTIAHDPLNSDQLHEQLVRCYETAVQHAVQVSQFAPIESSPRAAHASSPGTLAAISTRHKRYTSAEINDKHETTQLSATAIHTAWQSAVRQLPKYDTFLISLSSASIDSIGLTMIKRYVELAANEDTLADGTLALHKARTTDDTSMNAMWSNDDVLVEEWLEDEDGNKVDDDDDAQFLSELHIDEEDRKPGGNEHEQWNQSDVDSVALPPIVDGTTMQFVRDSGASSPPSTPPPLIASTSPPAPGTRVSSLSSSSSSRRTIPTDTHFVEGRSTLGPRPQSAGRRRTTPTAFTQGVTRNSNINTGTRFEMSPPLHTTEQATHIQSRPNITHTVHDDDDKEHDKRSKSPINDAVMTATPVTLPADLSSPVSSSSSLDITSPGRSRSHDQFSIQFSSTASSSEYSYEQDDSSGSESDEHEQVTQQQQHGNTNSSTDTGTTVHIYHGDDDEDEVVSDTTTLHVSAHMPQSLHVSFDLTSDNPHIGSVHPHGARPSMYPVATPHHSIRDPIDDDDDDDDVCITGDTQDDTEIASSNASMDDHLDAPTTRQAMRSPSPKVANVLRHARTQHGPDDEDDIEYDDQHEHDEQDEDDLQFVDAGLQHLSSMALQRPLPISPRRDTVSPGPPVSNAPVQLRGTSFSPRQHHIDVSANRRLPSKHHPQHDEDEDEMHSASPRSDAFYNDSSSSSPDSPQTTTTTQMDDGPSASPGAVRRMHLEYVNQLEDDGASILSPDRRIDVQRLKQHLERQESNHNSDKESDEDVDNSEVGSSRVDLQACKLEYSIVSPK